MSYVTVEPGSHPIVFGFSGGQEARSGRTDITANVKTASKIVQKELDLINRGIAFLTAAPPIGSRMIGLIA